MARGTAYNARRRTRDTCASILALVAALGLTDAVAAEVLSEVVRTAAPAAPVASTTRLNTTAQDISLLVPVRDVAPLGQVEVRITPADQVLVSVSDLARVLQRSASSGAVAAIEARATTESFAPIESFTELGLSLTFDPALLELVVGLDPTARLRRLIPLGFEGEPEAVPRDDSARFAAALTYQGTLDYDHVGPEEGLRSPRFNLDFDGRVRPIGFENRFTYDGDADQAFSRQASRLIYDQPERALRWTAGDLDPRGTSFQGSVDVAGLGLSRLIETYRSGRSLTATTSRTLTLQAPATVEIYVNGQPARTLQLGPGVFDLADLPLTVGASQVQIVVQDQAGDRQVINYDFFSDFSLLAPGLSEFDFQVGVRAPVVLNERDYLTDRPVATGFYRRGINDHLTAGANFQLSDTAQQVGAEATFASALGVFNGELAASNSDARGGGYAARLEYRFTQDIPDLANTRRINATIEHRSSDFSGIEDITQSNATSWLVSARLDQPVTRTVGVSVGADYARSRTAQFDDRYGASAGINWTPDPRISVSGRISYTNQTFVGRDEVAFGITATRRFGLGTTANASYDSADQRVQVGFSRGPALSARGIAYAAQLSKDREDAFFNGSANYLGNRGEIGVAHVTSLDRDGDISSQTSSVRASGTVAFADGAFAIGPRIYGAFAIVTPHPTLGDADVVLGNRFLNSETARSGLFGPALAPLSAYSRQTVTVDVPDAPPGYDLGSGVFEVYPWAHAGYRFVVGSAYNITVSGVMLDGEGQLLTLMSGTARSLDDADAPPRQLFTNRAGRFGVSGLSAGRWQIEFVNGLSYDLEVPGDQGALVRLGNLSPTSRRTTP